MFDTRVVLSVCFMLCGAVGSAQEGAGPQKYRKYMAWTKCEYIPANRGGGTQILRMKLNIGKHIPVGTKIELQLEDEGSMTRNKTVFVLQSTNRRGISFDWKLKPSMWPGTYRMRAAIPVEPKHKLFPDRIIQSAKVLKIIKSNPKIFPPIYNGWVWTYDQEKETIKIGTPEEWTALEERTCDVYDSLIGDLIKNKKEYDATFESIEAGKKYTNDGVLDQEALTKYVKKWRRQQGKIQKAIMDMVETDPAVQQRTLTSYTDLIRLGTMVSLDSVRRLRPILQTNNIKKLKTAADPKKKEDAVLAYFNYFGYRGKTDREALNAQVDMIYSVVCPEEEEEVEEPEPAKAEKKKPAPAKKK